MDYDISQDNIANDLIKGCLAKYGYSIEKFDTFDFTKAASCMHKGKDKIYIETLAEIRKKLKEHPELRIPGGSNGNISPCWGKNRIYSKEGGC